MYPRSLADFTGEPRESGTQLVYQHCPVCGSSGWHVYVNPETGQWYCFARGHGGGGHVTPGVFTDDVRRAMLSQSLYRATSPEAWPEVELPPWKQLSAGARAYLTSRFGGWSSSYHFVESEIEPRIVVPFFGADRRIVSWIARDYTDTLVPKYTQAPGAKPLYILPRWEPVDQLVLVEGVFDALAVYQQTELPVAAIGGTHLSTRSEQDLRQLARRRVVVMLDNDEAGQRATPKLVNRLRDRYTVVDKSFYLPTGADPGGADGVTLRRALGVQVA